jgi:hypothetical protein
MTDVPQEHEDQYAAEVARLKREFIQVFAHPMGRHTARQKGFPDVSDDVAAVELAASSLALQRMINTEEIHGPLSWAARWTRQVFESGSGPSVDLNDPGTLEVILHAYSHALLTVFGALGYNFRKEEQLEPDEPTELIVPEDLR